jgi:hypothetical protein
MFDKSDFCVHNPQAFRLDARALPRRLLATSLFVGKPMAEQKARAKEMSSSYV